MFCFRWVGGMLVGEDVKDHGLELFFQASDKQTDISRQSVPRPLDVCGHRCGLDIVKQNNGRAGREARIKVVLSAAGTCIRSCLLINVKTQCVCTRGKRPLKRGPIMDRTISVQRTPRYNINAPAFAVSTEFISSFRCN